MMRQLRGTELKRFLRGYRKTHLPTKQIVFLLQSVEYPVNVGSVFRIADACDVEEIVLTGITPTPPHPTIGKVARGKERRVRWSYVKEPQEVLTSLKGEGYTICALEITDQSVPYYAFDYPDRVCLVVGHEDHGVTRRILALCDAAVFAHVWQGKVAQRPRLSGCGVLPHSAQGCSRTDKYVILSERSERRISSSMT